MRQALGNADVVTVTDVEGRIDGRNVGTRNVLGWSKDEAIGRDASMTWTPEDRRDGVPETEMRLARREGRAADDRWPLRKDGSRLWVGGEMLPMRAPDGRLSGDCEVMRDRTDAHLAAERHAESEAPGMPSLAGRYVGSLLPSAHTPAMSRSWAKIQAEGARRRRRLFLAPLHRSGSRW